MDVLYCSQLNALLGVLQNKYNNARVCRRDACYRGEPDLERLMAESRDPAELLWGWQEWRRAVGPPSRVLYSAVVALMNQGARNINYSDIGACWREELETPYLESVVEDIYRQVEPLYVLLHAVVRFRLVQLYGEETVPPRGPIPAHLLGNT
jgi:peptidyl-dipeptidase A